MSMPYNSYAQPPISLDTKHQVSALSYASPINLFSPSAYQQIAEPPDVERIRQKDYVSVTTQEQKGFSTIGRLSSIRMLILLNRG